MTGKVEWVTEDSLEIQWVDSLVVVEEADVVAEAEEEDMSSK